MPAVERSSPQVPEPYSEPESKQLARLLAAFSWKQPQAPPKRPEEWAVQVPRPHSSPKPLLAFPPGAEPKSVEEPKEPALLLH